MLNLKTRIAKSISKAIGIAELEVEKLLSEPPSYKLGDVAFPCFPLSKQHKKKPQQIAKELAESIDKPTGIAKVEAVAGYVNFFYDKQLVIEKGLQECLSESFGISPKKKERVMVEYSQPNTHKAFHIGHLRNAALGSALVNIMRAAGYKVVAANYIGDIGTHVAKSLWYINKYCKQFPKRNQGEWLAEQYVKATQLLAEKPELKKKVDEVHVKLDNKEKYWDDLWQETRQWSLEEFNKIYDELGIKFDVWFFESEVAEAGKELAYELLKKGIAKKDQGSILVDLKKYGLGVFLILKKDGAPLYSTKDLELARRKFEDYGINRSIYVVGSEQDLYFKQLFKTLEIIGFKQAKKCYHLSYGLVQLKSGKMSSRLGNIVTYMELRDRVLRDALSEVDKRHKEWSKRKKLITAKKIMLSALKFTMLNKEIKKVIQFDVAESLSFEGESGPYLQYVYTRCNSIIKKANLSYRSLKSEMLKKVEEYLLIKKLIEFPEILNSIANNYKINTLPRYLLDIAQAFNQYYQKYKVIQSNKELMKARLALVAAVQNVIKRGLELLGIETLEEM